MLVRMQGIPVGILSAAVVSCMAGVYGGVGKSTPCTAVAAEGKPVAEAKTGVPAAVEQRIAQLVAQLGDKDYGVRQKAQDELAKLGFLAFDALTAASSHEDFEVASRARYLLRLIRSQWTTEKDPPEARQILEGYDLQNPKERAWRITRLVRLPRGGGISVVCRLIRFEKSPLVSAQAALEILHHEPLDQAGWNRLAQTLRENLLGSQRPAARWLLTYVQLRENPKATVEAWSKLVEAEARVLSTSPEQTVPGSAAMLAYLLAEAYLRLGDQAKADETAQRAAQLGGLHESVQLGARLQIASSLRRRGRIAWAEAEYLRLAEAGPAVHPFYKVTALVHASEMLHDQQRHEAAAETRRKAVELLRQLPPSRREQVKEQLLQFGMDPADLAARMSYFLACHWESKGDRAKQRQYLEEALRASAFEVDTLIALYQLPGQDDADRKKTQERIDKAVAFLRREVEQDPDDATAYNQAAWLMGNTHRSLGEALEFAKKAVELSPDSGAYLDTLAHVYFAQGDYDNAVRVQAQAAEIEPHSGLIAKELEAFRAAAEQKRSGKASSSPNRKG